MDNCGGVDGAEGRIRTDTESPPPVFETGASTIPPLRLNTKLGPFIQFCKHVANVTSPIIVPQSCPPQRPTPAGCGRKCRPWSECSRMSQPDLGYMYRRPSRQQESSMGVPQIVKTQTKKSPTLSYCLMASRKSARNHHPPVSLRANLLGLRCQSQFL